MLGVEHHPASIRPNAPGISQTGGMDKRHRGLAQQQHRRCFLAVLFRVLPCCIVLVLSSFQVMTECNPGMMRGLLVVASLVVLGGFTMMFGSVFVMLCRLFVMLVNFVLCHSSLPAFPRFNTR